jgi:hypothetical protein
MNQIGGVGCGKADGGHPHRGIPEQIAGNKQPYYEALEACNIWRSGFSISPEASLAALTNWVESIASSIFSKSLTSICPPAKCAIAAAQAIGGL